MRAVLVGEVRTADHVLTGMLRAEHPPVAIVTTPRDAVLRRSQMDPSYYPDLTSRARELDIPLLVVQELSEAATELEALSPDYLFIIGWPYMVRKPILELAPCVGMHPTPLPHRRGGAPLNWTILDGETDGAVTLLRLREGVDNGEILAQQAFAIGPDEYIGDVAERVYGITEELIVEAVGALAQGTARWTPQDETRATYTRRRTPEDGRICWRDSAPRIRNLVRAVSRPYPGAYSRVDDCQWTIWRAEIPRGYRAPLKSAPGTVLGVDATGVLVATRDNALLVTEATLGATHPVRGPTLAAEAAQWVGRVLE